RRAAAIAPRMRRQLLLDPSVSAPHGGTPYTRPATGRALRLGHPGPRLEAAGASLLLPRPRSFRSSARHAELATRLRSPPSTRKLPASVYDTGNPPSSWLPSSG